MPGRFLICPRQRCQIANIGNIGAIWFGSTGNTYRSRSGFRLGDAARRQHEDRKLDRLRHPGHT